MPGFSDTPSHRLDASGDRMADPSLAEPILLRQTARLALSPRWTCPTILPTRLRCCARGQERLHLRFRGHPGRIQASSRHQLGERERVRPLDAILATAQVVPKL